MGVLLFGNYEEEQILMQSRVRELKITNIGIGGEGRVVAVNIAPHGINELRNLSSDFRDNAKLKQTILERISQVTGLEFSNSNKSIFALPQSIGLVTRVESKEDEKKLLEKLDKCFEDAFPIKQGKKIKINPTFGICSSDINLDAQSTIQLLERKTLELDPNSSDRFVSITNEDKVNYCRGLAIQSELVGFSEEERDMNFNEFHLLYQPQYACSSLKSKKQTQRGIEALIRWNSNLLKGNIPPNDFIPLAELYVDVIQKMGYWTLEQAIKDYTSVSSEIQSKLGKVGINFSANQFKDPNLISTLDSIIKKYDFPSENLEIELTERVALSNSDRVHKIIRELLENYNITMALDDFGTGNATLAVLQEFDFRTIKLDKSFLDSLSKVRFNETVSGKPNAHYTFFTSIIEAAYKLNREVIIEGVETKEQSDFITSLKLPNISLQGYYFSKPESFSKVVENLRN